MHTETLPVDWESFAQVYHRHMPCVYRYFFSRIGNRHQCEDLTSAVFEKALRGLHTYCPERGSLEAWLFGIARRVLAEDTRRHRKQGTSVSLQELPPLPDPTTPERELLDREQRETLERCVLSLPERKQELIALKFGARLTNRRIAQIMDLSESNVGTLLYRTVRKLRDQLKGRDCK